MSAITGIVITAAGEISEQQFSELADYQKVVDGLIQGVYLTDGTCIYVNEEGLYRQEFGFVNEEGLYRQEFGFNRIATLVALFGGAQVGGLVGDAIVVGPADDEGETMSVTEKARGWINDAALSVHKHQAAYAPRIERGDA